MEIETEIPIKQENGINETGSEAVKQKPRVLLVNPSSMMAVYKKSVLKVAISHLPYISSAMLAASLLKEKIETQIIDLSVEENPLVSLHDRFKKFNPTHVGVTFTTPLFDEAKKIAEEVKKYNPKIILMCGGVHATALPIETLKSSKFDILVYGEGELTIIDVIKKTLAETKGIYYKKDNEIIKNPPQPLIENIDDLPFPAWHLYDIEKYKTSRLTSRRSPVGAIMTSRGCVFNCTYCNKNIFSRRFRCMSAKRVVDEMEYMLHYFNEIHIWDDMFTTKLDRAKEICDEIIRRGLKFPWALAIGIRVDIVDQEFLIKAKKAGCYAVYFGVESGVQEILDDINKKITLEQIKNAIKMAKNAGLETITFFMLGLPKDTIETMEKTIKFAQELDPDYAKTTILVPFPETAIFKNFEEKGLIKSKDWSKYNFHTASRVYTHPNLDWNTLEKYYQKFHFKFYFRLSYLIKRVRNDLKRGFGFLLYDIYYALKTFLTFKA